MTRVSLLFVYGIRFVCLSFLYFHLSRYIISTDEIIPTNEIILLFISIFHFVLSSTLGVFFFLLLLSSFLFVFNFYFNSFLMVIQVFVPREIYRYFVRTKKYPTLFRRSLYLLLTIPLYPLFLKSVRLFLSFLHATGFMSFY